MNFLEAAAEAFKKTSTPFSTPVYPITGVDYATYIHSQAWEDRKTAYFSTHQKRCIICLTWKHIDLHHIRYSARGQEPDEDLAPLCRTHHDLFHSWFGSKRDMRREWKYFVTLANQSNRPVLIRKPAGPNGWAGRFGAYHLPPPGASC